MRFQVILLAFTLLSASLRAAGWFALGGYKLPTAGEPSAEIEREVSALRTRLALLSMSGSDASPP